MEAQTLCTCCFSHLDHSGQMSLGLLSSQAGEARVLVPHGWGAVPPLPCALTGSDRCGHGLNLSSRASSRRRAFKLCSVSPGPWTLVVYFS